MDKMDEMKFAEKWTREETAENKWKAPLVRVCVWVCVRESMRETVDVCVRVRDSVCTCK